MMMERYPNLKEEVGGYQIFFSTRWRLLGINRSTIGYIDYPD
jgi:hypothetical protein